MNLSRAMAIAPNPGSGSVKTHSGEPRPGGSARKKRCTRLRLAVVLGILLLYDGSLSAYSVLTHMEIVDLVWSDGLRPRLLARYPDLSDAQITEAHSYAYGGALIQDLGYYPFGSVEFSDLLHYVRSGDFVLELLRQSQDANEYAFALGALSHYTSDNAGHPAVNLAVSMGYPALRAKYGKSVRYAQGKTAHMKTEFGFDVLQVAKNRYASERYHDFIGFRVSKPLLERAFPVVYGVELKDVLPRADLAIGSYRFAISRLIPEMTQIALQTHAKDLMREIPSFAKEKFLYRLSRSDYEKEWGKDYVKPGIFSRFLAALLRWLPKIGPFKPLAFDNPTPVTEELYFKSINTTVDHYRAFLEAVRTDSLVLPNRDLDDGNGTTAAEYTLADNAYARLLARQSERKFDLTTAELRTNILSFYADLSVPISTKTNTKRWQKILSDLERLKMSTPAAAASQR